MVFVAVGAIGVAAVFAAVLFIWPRTRTWFLRGAGVVAVLGLVMAGAYGYFMRPIAVPAAAPAQVELNVATRSALASLDFYLGSGTYTEGDIQHAAFAQFFNSYTPINALKMGAVLPDPHTGHYQFAEADRFVDAAIKQQLRLRGHALLFGKLSDVYKKPDLQVWLDTRFTDPEQKRGALEALVNRHIDTLVSRYAGRIAHWDVVNEPLALFGTGALEDNVYLRHLGPDYIAQAFRRAAAADPAARLFLNEQFDRYTGARAEAFIALVQQLKQAGVPLHGVGLQHHMLFNLASMEETGAFIQRLVALGVQVELTEIDARLRLFADEKDPHLAQALYYRDTVKICLQTPGCTGATFWGLHDQDAWHKDLPWMFAEPNSPYLWDKERQAKIGVALLQTLIAETLAQRQQALR
jgi:endo-1,4-beta-xylanase